MSERIKQAGRSAGLHLRRQAIAYVALAVALGGSAYAGGKGSSATVGAKDLKSMVVRVGNTVTLQPGAMGESTAECKKRERAIAPSGGGGSDSTGGVELQGITPLVRNGKAKGFMLTGFNSSTQAQDFGAGVTCLRP